MRRITMNKRTILIIIGIIVLVAAVFALMYLRAPKTVNMDFAQYQSSAGITFYYPQGDRYAFEEVSPEIAPDGLQRLIIVKGKTDSLPPEAGEGPPSMAILVIQADPKETVDSWLQKYSSKYIGPRISPATPMVIAGEEGQYFEADGLYATQVAVVKREDKIVMVIGAYLSRDSDLYKDFFTIASSVMFK